MPHSPVYGVYGITNFVGGGTYVGSGNIPARMCAHQRHLANGIHVNGKLQNSWNKHGSDNFQFYVIEKCDRALCISREQFWMDRLNAVSHGFNIRPKAETNEGHKWSDEAKARLIISPEKRAKLSAAASGKIPSEATRKKLSVASLRRSAELSAHFKAILTGRPKSPEHKEKLAEKNRRRAKEPGFGAMIAATKKGKKRKPFSAEWRANLSAATKKRWQQKREAALV